VIFHGGLSGESQRGCGRTRKSLPRMGGYLRLEGAHRARL
jgi:hypothetical protein